MIHRLIFWKPVNMLKSFLSGAASTLELMPQTNCPINFTIEKDEIALANDWRQVEADFMNVIDIIDNKKHDSPHKE